MNDEQKIVFTNNPIDDLVNEDYIGVESYISTFNSASNKANLVALTGDFGSGKSSIVNSIINSNEKNFDYVVVTLLHVINKTKIQDTVELNPIDLTKVMIQCFTDNDLDLKSYVNKKLSSFGEISFAKLDKFDFIYFYIFIAIVAIVYFSDIYSSAFISEFSYKVSFFNSAFIFIVKSLSYLRDFIPSIFLLVLFVTLAKSNLVFSHWDSVGKRTISEEDVIDLLYRVIIKILETKKKNKLVIVLEDSDRIDNYTAIIGFLKILYRIVKLEKIKDRIIFLVPIRDEFLICSESNEKNFTKIFDLNINIKKINSIDYKQIVLKLLKSKSSCDEFKDVFGTQLDEFPFEIGKILDGNEIDLRRIKNRLNSLFQVRRNIIGVNKKVKVSLESCANIAYLEDEFPEFLYIFTNNEKVCNKIFKKLSSDEKIVEGDFSDFTKPSYLKLSDDKFQERLLKFKEEFIKILNSEVFDSNIRMYFFRYPKDTYILDYFETELIKMLNNQKEHITIEGLVDKCYEKSESNYYVQNHLKLLYSFGKLPSRIIFYNTKLLFETLSIDYTTYSKLIIENVLLDVQDLVRVGDRLVVLYQNDKTIIKKMVLDTLKHIIDNNLFSKFNLNIAEFRIKIKSILYNDDTILKLLYQTTSANITKNELDIFYLENRKVIKNILNFIRFDKISINYVFEFLAFNYISDIKSEVENILNYVIKNSIPYNNFHYLKILINYELTNPEYQSRIIFDSLTDYKNDASVYLWGLLKNNITIEKKVLDLYSNLELSRRLSLKLLPLFYNNNNIERVIKIIVNFKIINIIDLSTKEVSSKISNFLLGSVDKKLLIDFRIFLIKHVEDCILSYSTLFSRNMPLINEIELNSIKELSTLNEIIAFDHFDSKLLEKLILKINITRATNEDYKNLIYKLYNNQNYLINSNMMSFLLENINFNSSNFKELDKDILDLLFNLIYINYQAISIQQRINVMLKFNMLDKREIDKLQNTIIKKDISDIIFKMINEKEDIRLEFSLINNVYLDVQFSRDIEILFKKVKNINYVISQILRNKVHFSKFSFADLIKVFKYTIHARQTLVSNDYFINEVCKNSLINELSNSEILGISKLTINLNILSKVFSVLNDAEINDFLCRIVYIEYEDLENIIDFLALNTNLARIHNTTLERLKKFYTGNLKRRITGLINKR